MHSWTRPIIACAAAASPLLILPAMSAAGCGAAPSSPPILPEPVTSDPTAAVVVSAAPIASAPASASSLAPAASSAPAATADIFACTLTTRAWTPGQGPAHLRFDASAPPFAELKGGVSPKVVFPKGSAAQGAVLEIDAHGVVVSGNIATTEIALYAQRPFVVAECLVPLWSAKLRWVEGQASGLRLSMTAGKRVRLIGTKAEAERGCEDVGLAPKPFKAESGLPAPMAGVDMRLRGWRKTALSAMAAGQPIAEINLQGTGDVDVDVVETTDKESRILWSTDDALVFGWVAKSALVKRTGQLGEAYGTGGLGLSGVGASSHLRCQEQVPLSAQVGGVRRVVGHISIGTEIERVRLQNDSYVVRFPNASVTAAQGADFLVEAGELHDCR